MKPKAIGFGAGGHASVVIDALRERDEFELVGVLDRDSAQHGKSILGIPVLGGDELLSEVVERGVHHFFIGVGSVGDSSVRRRIFERASGLGLHAIGVVHPSSIIAQSATMGAGVCVLAAAVVNVGARIGDNVILNTGVIIEHDCIIGSHAHVASGARLAGQVTVGADSHIGLGACVIQGIKIGQNSIIGAGAVVVRDIPDGVVAFGVPARVVRPSSP